MGRATILQSLGAGQYHVRVEFDNAAVDAKLAAIDTKLTEITAKLAELATAKADKLALFNSASDALNAYIAITPTDSIIADPSALNTLTAALYKARLAYDKAAHDEKRAKLQKTGLEKEKEYLEKYCPADFETTAWCPQFNESLTGTVQTIEIDYLLERDVITNQIRRDTGFWLVDPVNHFNPVNTQLQHPLASSAHANWFNLAIAPAVQRDAPRFRVATIIDAAAHRIQFDGQYDTEEFTTRLANEAPIFPAFNGVQQEFYTDARFLYPCADIYEDGDRVIVEMAPYDIAPFKTPTVVGFYSNPRQCSPPDPDPEFLFRWPKFTVRLAGDEAITVSVDSDVLLVIYSASSPSDPYVPPDYDLRLRESPDHAPIYLKYAASTIGPIYKVVRAADYPATPDFPGTGNYTYVSGGFSATFPRRFLTMTPPAAQIARIEPPHGANGEQYVQQWALASPHPFARNPTDPGDLNIPQATREYRMASGLYRWAFEAMPASNWGGDAIAEGAGYFTTFTDANGGLSLLSASYEVAEGTFTATKDLGAGGIFTTDYALNRIIAIGGINYAEFWCLGDPDVYL
jgi:hypothetical protein